MGAIKDLVDKRDYKAALSEIKKIDVENSMNPQFMVLCGRVYAENKKFDEARKTLISAHILAPKSEQVIEEIIRLYLKIGYFTKAKQYFKIYTTIVPMESIEGQRVLYNVKKALSASDDELIGILQGILNKEYIDELAFELALLYRKAGRNEDSIKECDKIFSSFAQSNLYVKWAKPLKMGSINVNKAFNCYPKDEVPEQSGNIYQYVQKENEQLKKDFIEVEGGDVTDATAPEDDDSVIVENIDDDDAISVDAEVTETATVVGGSKNAYVHKPDEEVEVEIIEEGSSDEDETESDTLMLEEDTEAARQRDEEGSEIEDIKAALDKIARAERRKEEAMEAAKKEQQSEEDQSEEPKPEEPQPEEPQPEESQSEEQVVEEQSEEVEVTEPEPVAEVEESAEEPEPVPEEAPTEEVEAEVPEQEVASDEAPPESNDDAQGYDYDEEEAFDMADDNKPKLSLKLAGGGGGGGRGGSGPNRSSFGGGGMRSGMGGQILSKEEREFMANYDDSKLQQREAAAKERAKRAKQAMAAEEEKRIAAEKRAEMEREQAEARARAEAEKQAAEEAHRAEEEAKVAEARAQAEAVARAEAEAEAAKRAEAEARAKAESDAKVAEERRIQQEREKALEDARAKQILEQRQAEEEARRKAEEAKRAEEEAKKAEEERKIKEEEERAAKALAEQERLRNSVSRARSKADQEREDAIAAIRAKVEAERAAKEEKKRKAQEQLDEQERRRIKKLPPFKRKSISKEVLDRLGLAIDEKGELIDPPPKQEEAPAAEAQTQETQAPETQEVATVEAQTDESANQEDAPKADLSTAEPQAPQDGVNEAEPDENRPETIEVNAGREAEETDNVEVNAGREAEPTDNIEVNAGREAEATDNIEVNATREPEAEGVKVEDDGVTLGNVALAGGSLSDVGLGGESINRDGHSEVTLDNVAFAGDKLVTDETFEEEQRLKAEEEAKKAEEEAKLQAEQQAEAEPEPQPEPEPEQAEEEIEEEVEVEAVEEETEVEVVEDAQTEEVEAEPQPEVIELGTEPEVDSDVVEVKEEAVEEPAEEVEAEQDEPAEVVEEETGEAMVIDGIEIDKYGVPVKAEKHVAKYAASVGFRKQFRKNIEQVIEKKGIYRNLVVLAGEGAKVSNVAIDYARAYHDIGLVKTKVVATIKASVLNKTDLNKILSKLKGGCLVIEQAGYISSEKAEQVYEIVNNPDNDVVLMLVGEADSVKDMFKESPDLNSLFHSILLLHDLSDKDLADMAVAFMQQNGFKPDEEGLKVLNDKIDSMDAKGIDEIISFVGNALNRAEQRAKDTLGDVVFNGDLEDGGLNTVKAMDFE